MAFTKIEKKIIAALPVDQQPSMRKAIMEKRKLLRDGRKRKRKLRVEQAARRNEKKVVDTPPPTLLESYDQVRASWAKEW